MKLLSFDVGIKNLAFCQLDTSDKSILDWGIINISIDPTCEHIHKGKCCDKTATKFDFISFDDAYSKGLKVMDMTAFTLCKENDLPIIVFDMDTPGNLRRLIEGEQVGTIVRN